MRTPTLAARVQLALGWNKYSLLNTDIVNFAAKTDVGEGRKHWLVNFCSLVVLESSLDEGWWGESKLLFRAS